LTKQLIGTRYRPIIGVIRNTQDPHIELAEIAQSHHIDTKIFDCCGQFDVRTLFALRCFLTRNKVGILHSHGYKADFYAMLATRFKKISLLATCHPWNETEYSLKARLYARLDRVLLRNFDKIVAVSDEIRRDLLASGISESKVSIIDNGIDIQRFAISYNKNEIRKKFNIRGETQVIGTIGRLTKEKGHLLFIQAARMLRETFPNTFFIVVGDGPLRKKLQKKSVELGLQNHLLFMGIRKDIPKLLAVMDIFVLPSLSEGLPMVLLEAMAARKPIVATNVGAISKAITHNKSGILVRANVHDLKEGIAALLCHKDKCRSLAKKGYEKVTREFSSEHMAQKYIEIYEQL